MKKRIVSIIPALFLTINVAAHSQAFQIIDNDQVVIGATELMASPGVRPSADWANFVTFYNVSALKIGNDYILWAQTNRFGSGCRTGEGRDNVIVFRAVDPAVGLPSPAGPFLPKGYDFSDTITRSDLRASLVTDTVTNNECDLDNLWGLGEVIPFDGSYLAMFDLSRTLAGDAAKFELLLAATNGLDLLTDPVTFANSDMTGDIIVDPAPFVIDSNTIGVIFTISTTDFQDTRIGYLYLSFPDFSADPSNFDVFVLGSSGVYHQLSSATGYRIDFTLGNISGSGLPREINRVIRRNDELFAFYSKDLSNEDPGTCVEITQGSELRYRKFLLAGNQFGGWTSTDEPVFLLSTGNTKRWDGIHGIFYPSPLIEPNDDLHLYWSQDNDCQDELIRDGVQASAFRYHDINYAQMLDFSIFSDGFDSGNTSKWSFQAP